MWVRGHVHWQDFLRVLAKSQREHGDAMANDLCYEAALRFVDFHGRQR
jgi:hypothetical protein